MRAVAPRARSGRADKKEISWQAVYYHFRKWSQDGSLEHLWQHSVTEVRDDLDLSHLNLDGSHALAKKGGESVGRLSRAQKDQNLEYLDGDRWEGLHPGFNRPPGRQP